MLLALDVLPKSSGTPQISRKRFPCTVETNDHDFEIALYHTLTNQNN